MSFISNLYKSDDEEENKFKITRGMLILGISILVIVIVLIIIIVSVLKGSKEEYNISSFNKLEKRMVEEAPIYLFQKNIELTEKEIKIDLKDMLTENGGSIDPDKVKAAKVCDGYVIAKKVEGESYSAYIKCKDLYTTSGYISNDITTTKKKTTTASDKTKPDITIIGENELSINLGTVYKDQGAKAMDNVDGDITSKIKVTGSVDTKKEGVYTITYTVTDKAGNTDTKTRKVTVVPVITTTIPKTTTKNNTTTRYTTKRPTTTTKKPTTSPTITLYGSETITLYVGNSYNEPGYSAKDSLGANITSKVQVTSYVNTKVAGTYYVNYSVTDSYGNSASKTRIVVVKSNYITLKGITLTPNAPTLNVGGKVNLTVYFNPTNATNKNVTWSSDNPSVATVSGGTVTAKSKGTAIITVTGADGISASARITVK